MIYLFIFKYFLKYILFIYFQREGKGGRKRGRDTSMCKRNISWLPLALPQPGNWPATQAFIPTGNQTGDPLVHRLTLNLLSHTRQSFMIYFYVYFTLANSTNFVSLILFKFTCFSILPLPLQYFSLATILRVRGGVRQAFPERITFSQSPNT